MEKKFYELIADAANIGKYAVMMHYNENVIEVFDTKEEAQLLAKSLDNSWIMEIKPLNFNRLNF